MWITGEIDLPDELLDAHANGDLVLFVGAGASMAPPAGHPNFRSLAEIVATQLGHPASDQDLLIPDEFLGELAESFGVHQAVRSVISRQDAEPNPLHHALVRLASAGGRFRMVTTNYDTLLTAAADDVNTNIYCGPALPLGDDFTGIVYLHGSIDNEPCRLIVTDRDFGTAYLTRGWATDFLRDMFSRFIVLFVGYSHSDVVMRYLARGLPRNSKPRYALTDKADTSEWTRLGVVPLNYEPDQHDQVLHALETWARHAEDSPAVRVTSVQRIAELDSPIDILESSRLQRVLCERRCLEAFCRAAASSHWLAWVANNIGLDFLTDASPAASQALWTAWFGERIASPPTHAEALRQLVSAPPVSLQAWSTISMALWRSTLLDEKQFTDTVSVLVQQKPRGDRVLSLLFQKSVDEDYGDAALILFDAIASPSIEVRPSVFDNAHHAVSVEVSFLFDEYDVTEANKRVLADRQHLLDKLAPIAILKLQTAHTLGRASAIHGPAFDPVSWHRQAIEEHPQDRHRIAADPLIDLCRDFLRAEFDRDTPTATAFAEILLADHTPILRRVALDGICSCSELTGDEQLALLTATNVLADEECHHEVFTLLAAALPSASESGVEALIAAVADGEPTRAGDPDRTLTILQWIKKYSQPNDHVEYALSQYPPVDQAVLSEHPSFRRWFSIGSWVDESTEIVSEVVKISTYDAREAVSVLLDRSAHVGSFHPGQLAMIYRTVQACAAANPAKAIGVKNELLNSQHPQELESGRVFDALLAGWQEVELTGTDLAHILEEIHNLQTTPVAGSTLYGICDFLEHQVRGPKSNLADADLDAMCEIASVAWEHAANEPSMVSGPGDLARSLNSSAGKLASFWVGVASVESRLATGGDEKFLSTNVQSALERMLNGCDVGGELARATLFVDLRYLTYLDEEWSTRNLLSALDGTALAPLAAWTGFLTRGTWDHRLVRLGLLDRMLDVSKRLDLYPDEAQRRAAKMFAEIALYGEPEVARWLPRLVSNLPPQLLPDFARHITTTWAHASEVRSIPVQPWDAWLQEYWSKRLDGIPIALSGDEATQMNGWVLIDPGASAQAAELATRGGGGLEAIGNDLSVMGESDLYRTDPDVCASWVIEMAHNTDRDRFYHQDDLKDLLERLISASPHRRDELVSCGVELGLYPW